MLEVPTGQSVGGRGGFTHIICTQLTSTRSDLQLHLEQTFSSQGLQLMRYRLVLHCLSPSILIRRKVLDQTVLSWVGKIENIDKLGFNSAAML